MSKAWIKLLSGPSPIVKMREPETETVEKPWPMPWAFQARGGPPAGHSVKRPVSGEMSSRFGPRHWGQSEAGPLAKQAGATRKARQHNRDKKNEGDILFRGDLCELRSKVKWSFRAETLAEAGRVC